MKISCTMIVKNEALNLERCLESVRSHVDELVIVDTGSTDGTPEIAKRYADKFEVFLGCNDPQTGMIEDFAMARNRALELATGDWLFWLDGDDVLVNGENLRKLAAESTDDNVHFLFPYEYTHDAAGNCTAVHLRERLIFPRHRYQWQCPVHEGCLPIMPLEGAPLVAIPTDAVRVVHQDRQPKKREAGRNKRILEKYLGRVGEGDPRAIYYLGLEYSLEGRIGECIRTMRRYIELTTWREDERCLAMLGIARCYQALGDHELAIEWACKALVAKSWSEPHWVLGRSFYELGMRNGSDADYQFRRAAHWIQRGIASNPTGAAETVQLQNPRLRFEIHEILNVCLSRIGDLDGAIASCKAGLQGMPESLLLQGNLEVYRKERAKRIIKACLDELGVDQGKQRLIRATLSGDVQVTMLDQPTDMPAPKVAALPVTPGKLDLVFYVGHGLEPWNPETVRKTGIGGSETMVIELGKRLAAMGHRVRVYGHCTRSMEGVHDGVEWYDASRYHGVKCDVLIASRRPDAVDDAHELDAGARVLWVHDVHCGDALTLERDLRFDRVLALSQWHKALLAKVYPLIDPGKIVVTRNGIDLARFRPVEPVERVPYRVVYSSSPDRGLENLLDMWPEIRRLWPKAELRVFYGFEGWEAVAKMTQDRAMMQRIHQAKSLCQSLPGVKLMGRVSQTELAREFLAAEVWAYPTWFEETSCITAMEAQAAGLHVITTALAALNETVGAEGTLIAGDPRTPEYRDKFIVALNERFQRYPSENPFRGERFSLDTLAADWDKMLTEIHASVRENVVPAFHAPRLEVA